MTNDFKQLNDMLTVHLETELPAKLGKPDWTYRDLPQMLSAFMTGFIELVGEENLHWITRASYPNGMERGQVLISPAGMERIEQYNDVKSGEANEQ